MPSLTLEFLNLLQENFKDYPIFVETGTYNGETIFQVEHLFDKLYTVEINKEIYETTKRSYKGNKINFLFGDSGVVVKNILNECNNKVLFFLDAHASGGNLCNFEITPLYTPLEQEIMNINTFSKHESLIIVDDCRALGTKNNGNWEFINESVIKDILKERLLNLYYLDCGDFKNDRMIIHIRNL
jgi:hypothetical protein